MKNKSSGKNLRAWSARLFGYTPPASDDRKKTLAEYLRSQSAYEDRPNPHWDRQQPAGVLYRKAHGMSDEDSHVPPSRPVLISHDEALTLLRSYGLDVMLTPEDDATLWAAVISAYWPQVHDAKINIGGLRFGVGTFDDETSLKLQPIAGWCFERVNETTLKTSGCHDKDIDGRFDAKLRALPNTTLFTMTFLRYDDELPHYPNMAIVIERPSIGKQEVVVYNGAQLGHNMGYGNTGIYTHIVGGWQESGRILAHWIS